MRTSDRDLYRDLETLRPRRRPRGRRAGRRPRRLWVTVAVVAGVALLLGAAGTAAGVWVYVQNKFRETHDPTIATDPVPAAGRPLNILVLGSDDRSVIPDDERDLRHFAGDEGGQRADVIILVHLSADGDRAFLLHFPRDLRVSIPGRGFAKINAAYAGGPNLVIDTIRQHTGLDVHHFVEVNFQSFRQVVDAVGGVGMCVDRDLRDPRAGLDVAAGCHHFDGDTSLAFVRSRDIHPDADFGRIASQQLFVRRLMERVTSLGFLVDFPRIVRLANAVGDGIVTDQNLTLGLVRQLGNRLAGFQQERLDTRMVPSDPAWIGGVSYVVERDAEARALYEAIARSDPELPPYGRTQQSIPEPGDVEVTVLNGSGTSGLAGEIADDLRARGYRVAAADNADRSDHAVTVIRYRPEAFFKAQLVAEEFPGARLELVTEERLRTEVVIILGADRVPADPGS